MNRTILFCVVLCLLSACESGSSSPNSDAPASSVSPTGDEHLSCVGEGGVETGQSPLPVLHIEDRDIPAHYGFGTRESCPWLVDDGITSNVIAIDGGTVGGVDAEVAAATQLTVSVRRWSDDITIDSFGWRGSGEEQQITPAETEPGQWDLTTPTEPGEYGLSLRFHWDYGEDSWFWSIRVVN
jgi:hypothetical protein